MSIFEYDEELHMATVREEGIAQGRKEGITKGISQGRKDANIELIRNMYRCNFTLDQIALATQKSIDEINAVLFSPENSSVQSEKIML